MHHPLGTPVSPSASPGSAVAATADWGRGATFKEDGATALVGLVQHYSQRMPQ